MRCWKCNGTGFIFEESETNCCSDCNGYGVVEAPEDLTHEEGDNDKPVHKL